MTKKEIEYLKHKHTGGTSNEKGNRYESYYAVKTIVRLINKHHGELDKVAIQSQVPMAYLDDLLTVEPDKKTYHQIKDVKGINWTTGKNGHTLKTDFLGQKKLCKEKGESFVLKLVYSDRASSVKTKPRGLIKKTEVEFFPAKDLNALVVGDRAFQAELRQLLYLGERLPLDRIANLAISILGVWCSSDTKTPVGLDVLDKEIASNRADYYSNQDATLSPDCIAVFESMGVGYMPSGASVTITWKKLTASIEWSDEIQDKIIAAQPHNIIELFTLL